MTTALWDVRLKVLSMTHVDERGRTRTIGVDLPATVGTIAEIHPSDEMHTEHVQFLIYGRPMDRPGDKTNAAYLLGPAGAEIAPRDYFGKLRIEAQDTRPTDVSFRVILTDASQVLHIG